MRELSVLTQALLELGTDSESVKAMLQAHGINGVRNTVRYLNPIVRFTQLRLKLDDYALAVTHGDSMPTYLLHITLPSGAKASVPFPEPVKDFLDRFNAGAYPELEM